VRIILVRHGQTNHNRDSIALGRDDVPLNETGLAQAAALASRLSSERISAIYTSPLQRARHTAEAIAKPHALTVISEPALVEMDVGELDSLPYPTIRERFPGVIERWRSESGSEHPFPGGESLMQVAERAWPCLERLAEGQEQGSVVIVTHNFVLLSMLAKALGLPLAHFRRLKHEVAAISVLDITPERCAVISVNDTCHLTECG
jgi:phosphoserine phosphatase